MTDRRELGYALSFALGALLGAGVVAWCWRAAGAGPSRQLVLPRRNKASDDETPLFI